MKAQKVTQAEYETLAAFRYALRRFLHFSEKEAKAAGVTPQQHQALLAIKGFPGRERVTIGEFAERLQLRHHSAVGLVDRLVAKKLALRLKSEGDSRQVFVRLAERGEKVLEKLSAAHRQQLKQIGPELARALSRLNDLDE
jgi:DNA-binding MarR family transcriptional regulator